MPAVHELVDRLPRQTASHIKNKWRDVVREVRESGSVAVTNHSKVELVLVNAERYEQLAASEAALKARETSVLQELEARFSERLATLQAPDAHDKVAAVLAARGTLPVAHQPKAGDSF